MKHDRTGLSREPQQGADASMQGISHCPDDDFVGFFDPARSVANVSGNLPHWRQDHVTYFVTFRLADSMPQELVRQWLRERQTWLQAHPEPHDDDARREYLRLFTARFERWLDAGHGACILGGKDIRALVEDTLRHFHERRYFLDEHVVMPNHVHALVTPLGEHELSSILRSWKSFTAHQINQRLGRKGPVWQKEYFDHIVRGADQIDRIRQYIRDNPKAISGSAPRCRSDDRR